VEKLLYSRRDAARALSLSVRSIDYLIYTGRIPTRRVGGKILIHVSDVRRFAKTDHPGFVRVPPGRSVQESDKRKSA
jgi:excisionase family DNA binding protein